MPSLSGRDTLIILSSLPGLKIAGSSISFLLVHPIIFTFPRFLNPSISARSCINVLCTSLSPLVPTSILFAANASSSSMNTIDGAFSLASSNISFISFAPSPINFCTSSDATTSINVELVDEATAFARRVFPVPGTPYNSAPFGGFIPIFLKRAGFFNGSSTISCISFISSLSPPISFQDILGFSIITNFSTLNFFECGAFFMIVRFFCSARAVSPGVIFLHSQDILTRNSFPFWSLTIAWSFIISMISHIIRGADLYFSNSLLK